MKELNLIAVAFLSCSHLLLTSCGGGANAVDQRPPVRFKVFEDEISDGDHTYAWKNLQSNEPFLKQIAGRQVQVAITDKRLNPNLPVVQLRAACISAKARLFVRAASGDVDSADNFIEIKL